MYEVTVIGHVKEIAVLVGIAVVMASLCYMEYRRKKSAPKPMGATRV